MSPKTRYDPLSRIGINEVNRIFVSDFKWIPRDVLQSDVGIDIEVEICESGTPTGQLLAVQVKTGSSYFKEFKNGHYTYRGDVDHLNYWLNHCLPVILVLHNPDTNETIWQKIDPDNSKIKGKTCTIDVPANQQLSLASKDKLMELTEAPLYLQKLQRFAIHKELMLRVADGEEIYVQVEEWINKMSGLVTIKFLELMEVGQKQEEIISEASYLHFSTINDLYKIYPWADFDIDEFYYDMNDDSDEDDRHYIRATDPSYQNNVIGKEIIDDLRSFVYPIETGYGEIHIYRLRLLLNETGKAFLMLNNFIEM